MSANAYADVICRWQSNDGNIDVGTLLPTGDTLLVGGNTPLQFQPYSGINVIQARSAGWRERSN